MRRGWRHLPPMRCLVNCVACHHPPCPLCRPMLRVPQALQSSCGPTLISHTALFVSCLLSPSLHRPRLALPQTLPSGSLPAAMSCPRAARSGPSAPLVSVGCRASGDACCGYWVRAREWADEGTQEAGPQPGLCATCLGTGPCSLGSCYKSTLPMPLSTPLSGQHPPGCILSTPLPLLLPLAPCAVAQPDDIAAFSLQSSHPLHKTSKVRVPLNRANNPWRQRVFLSVAAANDSWLVGWLVGWLVQPASHLAGRGCHALPRHGPTHPPHPLCPADRVVSWPSTSPLLRTLWSRPRVPTPPCRCVGWRVCAVSLAGCAPSLALPSVVPEGCAWLLLPQAAARKCPGSDAGNLCVHVQSTWAAGQAAWGRAIAIPCIEPSVHFF